VPESTYLSILLANNVLRRGKHVQFLQTKNPERHGGGWFAGPISDLQAIRALPIERIPTVCLPCNREPERTHDVSGRCALLWLGHPSKKKTSTFIRCPFLVQVRL
jgi:hypothetical protein